MILPSSVVAPAGVVDVVIVVADGGRRRTNARSPFVDEVTMASR